MKVLILDDNVHFARSLAARLGDSSESFFDVDGVADDLPEQSDVEQVQDELDNKLRSENAPALVLINRELKLKDVKRQYGIGQSLLAACSWKYDAHFQLYSFRSLPGDLLQGVIHLPSDFASVSLPGGAQVLEMKIEQCLSFIDNSFKKIQHGYKEVNPTTVEVVRLLHGAVKAGRIRSEAQFDDLVLLLYLFLYIPKDTPARAMQQTEQFNDAVKRLVELYVKRSQVINNHEVTDEASTPQCVDNQLIIVVDDEVYQEDDNKEGSSPWASILNIIYKGSGKTFETRLPSRVRSDVRSLDKADLIVLDVDYQFDLNYEGDRGYGGLDLLKVISKEMPRTPVLMMSRYDEIGLYEECMDHGAFNYLTKSWSNYSRFRTKESEKDWFLRWESRIDIPLRYGPFFDDMEMFRSREIVSRKESQQFLACLRDIESPTSDTTRALVTFFEQFVIGYLYYRGQTPPEKLKECLDNPVFARNGQNSLPLGKILRIIRNNATHNSAYIDEKYDAWLVLVLMRTFYLGQVSPHQQPDASWMCHLQERLTEDLAEMDFTVDEHLFKNIKGEISEVNRTLWARRNDLLRRSLSSYELENDEFGELAAALIKSLAVVLPRYKLSAQGFQLPNLAAYDGKDLVEKLIKKYTKNGNRFRRGYEILSSVWWLFDMYGELVQPGRQINRIEKSILRMMIVRCWLWYFRQLLREPNELLFSSALDELTMTREAALADLKEKLVQHFRRRKLWDFIPAYTLLVSLAYLNSTLEQMRAAFEEKSSRLQSERRALEEKIIRKDQVHTQFKTILQKKAEIVTLNSQLERLWPQATRREIRDICVKLEERIDKCKEELRELEETAQHFQNEVELMMLELGEIGEKQAAVSEVFGALSDAAVGEMSSIDKTEAIARRVRRQFGYLKQFATTEFNLHDWLDRVMKADDYQGADSCISELKKTFEPRSVMVSAG